MKKCSRCKIDKDESNYHNCKTKKDGLTSFCKDCSRKFAYNYYLNNKKLSAKRSTESVKYLLDLVETIKEKYGCFFCSEREKCVLEFHHPNDDKSDDISKIAQHKNKNRLFEEINKCIVVCANCHKKIHRGILSDEKVVLCNEDINNYFENRKGRLFKIK